MEDSQKEPSLKQKENLSNLQNFLYKNSTNDKLSSSFPNIINNNNNNLPKADLMYKTEKNNISKDCIHEPDNVTVHKTTSNLGDKNKNIFDKRMCPPLDKEISVDNLMESVDLSDLTFSCNDFILGDCDCFEQASQLVDPTLKDSESTPFSFNNSDSVQLFRFSLTESTEDNLTCLNNLFNKDNYEKCDKGNEAKKNDHYNFYRVFELIDSNINIKDVKKKEDSLESKKNVKGRKSKESVIGPPIKKGRRYLPNFKQKVLEYTKNHTFKETAMHFKINCNTITEWSRESKRLSQQPNKPTIPGSDYNNYKTDIVDAPETKTEIILFNDVYSFETDPNETSLKNIEDELPSVDLTPDERFIKWMETKRKQKKQLTRLEVYQTAKHCLRKCPVNQEKPSWFVLWFKRYSKALKNSIKSNETEKYIKYPNNFKLEVALYGRIFTKNSAARLFNVPRRRMFDWFNCLNPLKDSFEKKETGHVSEKDKIACETKRDKIRSKIYSELYLWYQKRFLNGFRPTSYEIKEKGKEIFNSYGIPGIKFSDGWLQKFCQRMNIKLRHSEDDRLLLWVLEQFDNNVTLSHQEITEKSSSLIGKKKFKGSKGWTLRFLKRHRNFLQYSPTVQDQLPSIVQDKINQFCDNFRERITSLEIESNNIGCMDEIPLCFNYPEEGKETSLPLLRKTGFENCQGVVILSALANGRILPPAVLFKGNGPKQLLSHRNIDILILYQEKGLITFDVLKDWFNDIWLSCTSTPSVLVVDSFQPHRAIQTRQLFDKENCLLQIIPEGCSSRFQPLNVELTPLFKETIKQQWKEFPTDANSSGSVMRKYRCPDQDTILHWVQNSYEKIKRNPVSIINSFKSTSLLQ